MRSGPLLRILVAGVSAAALMVGFSFVINEAWLGEEHARHAFFRADDDPLRMPGLAVSSLAWGVLLAWGYHRFAGALRVRRGAARGAVFGGVVFGLFVLVHEVFYFQFIAMSTLLFVASVLHYLVSYVAAGALVGHVLDRGAR
jgi:hypothetical protein